MRELPHGKGSVSSNILRAATNENGEVTGLDNILHTSVPQTDILDQDRNLDSLGRASWNNNLVEALQCAVGNDNRSDIIGDIYLNNFRAIPSLVGVCHINAHGNAVVGRRNGGAVDTDGPILESGVTLAVAEWIPGKWVAEDVLVPENEGPVAVFMARIANRAARVQVIVEDREVADVPGETNREFARGVVVTEQDIGKGIATFFRWVELLDKSSCRVGDPCVGDRLAAGENDDGRYASISNGLDERALGADQGKVIFVDMFTGSNVESGSG